MYHGKKTTVIIPAYNEGKTIATVVRGALEYADEVVVVDDCSSDNTQTEAESAGAITIRHEKNAGYDAGLSDGFAEAFRRGADILISFDADGQHKKEDLSRLAEPIARGEVDMVISQRPHITHFAEKLFAVYTRLRHGIRDPLCGFKAYSREVYETVGHFDTVSSIGTELMLSALTLGFRAKFIEITILERADTSRFYKKIIRANWKIFKAMVRVIGKTAFLQRKN